jgi:unsaturated chondroitin disaccharide hydrolase
LRRVTGFQGFGRIVSGLGLVVFLFASSPAAEAPSVGYGLWVDESRAAGISDQTQPLRAFLQREVSGDRRRALTDALAFARAQVDRTALLLDSRPADEFPLRTDPATGEWEMVNVTYWSSGHWVGQLWDLHSITGDPRYAARALLKADRIAASDLDLTWSHDQGFLFGLSHVKGLPFVDEPARTRLEENAIAAAGMYLRKANPHNGLIHWHGTYEDDRDKPEVDAIVDSMMNVPFLWWASEASGDPRYRAVGLRHAEAVRAHLVRADFSTAHAVRFDPRDGRILGQDSAQGHSKDSMWARGHSWAIYGFAVVYAKTGDRRWLETARGLADFYLAHPRLPADHIPYWDLDAPRIPNEPRDSSAAAIVAAGLQQLARFEDDPQRAEGYLRRSIAILETLSGPFYFARGTNDQALILHGCRNHRKGVSDNGLVFGDYYYLEALIRLLHW